MRKKLPFDITNIVLVGIYKGLTDKIPIYSLTPTDAFNIDFTPKKFPALFMKSDQPKCTILFFSSGKFVVTGLNNVEGIDPILIKLTDFLAFNNYNLDLPTYTIQNIVALGCVGANIDLNNANCLLNDVIYEPDLFPGMIMYDYCMPMYKRATVLVFSSGKAICAGLDSVEKVDLALKNITKKIEVNKLNHTCFDASEMEAIDIKSLF